MHDYQSIDALVSGVTGTTGFISRLISRKSGFVFMFLVFVVIISTLLFN